MRYAIIKNLLWHVNCILRNQIKFGVFGCTDRLGNHREPAYWYFQSRMEAAARK